MPAAAATRIPLSSPSREVKLIVVHCSASPNGRRVTLAEIDRWHKARGFRRDPRLIGANQPNLLHIGYHYVIEAAGPVTIGRGEREVGAHVAGFNRASIGICMVGIDAFAPAQWASLRGLVRGLKERYPLARVCGHRDLSPDQDRDGIVEPFEWLKTCPGFDVSTWFAGGMQPPLGHILGVSP